MNVKDEYMLKWTLEDLIKHDIDQHNREFLLNVVTAIELLFKKVKEIEQEQLELLKEKKA